MATTLIEATPSSEVAFSNARWHTRWIVVGLVILLLWRSVNFIDREWLAQFPSWLLLIIAFLAPQAFLLIFPILTRNRNSRLALGFSAPTRYLIEFGIAVLVTIGTLVVLTSVNYIVGRISPGTSLTPDAVTDMARSPNRTYVYFLLLFSFTFAPIAEEVFFRGFLHNAFRARMPVLVAVLAQSLIFGFGHFFGVTHAGVAFMLGLLLTAVYEWRRTLVTPIFVHAGINFVAAFGTALMMAVYANSPVMGVIGDSNDTECVIRQIAPNSAAQEAGLRVGDIITMFNTEPIRDFPHLVQTVTLYRSGDAIPVTINRSGTMLEVSVVLRRRGDP
jgi:membrane protease YdiL (CAAX protease family)